ncbi:MBL fold metallo-hydrolase [candidate division WOR-3 bacterium]|nr:MBL fold metallo-hydrolase [candidate division WOR-3 bacterium]
MIISVYDNYSCDPDLRTSWGFSTIVSTGEELILFDTGGDSQTLLFNMMKVGVNPGSVTKVFISHIHRDHMGGLEGFLDANNKVTVYIPCSFPAEIKEMITKKEAQYIEVSDPQEISDGVFTTGVLPGDPCEQSLIIETSRGSIIITGCAHPGIVDIVTKAIEMTGNKPFLVLGGFHSPPLETVQRFRDMGVKKVAPSHCSGDRIRDAFREEYGEHFIEYGVGKIIHL